MAASHEDRNAQLSPGVAIKAPCRAATTAAITLSGEQTIDVVACVTGDRVLVKNQTDQTTNGIYLVSTGAWTREPDFDGNRDVVKGTFVFITNGATNAGAFYECTAANPVVFGSSALTFAQGALGPIAIPISGSNVTFTQSGTPTANSVSAKLQQIISVKDAPYNAVGDGVTDDTAAIQAALTAAALTGASVYAPCPSVNYFMGTTGITVSGGIRFYGDAGTSFVWGSGFTGTAITITNNYGIVENINLFMPKSVAAPNSAIIGIDIQGPLNLLRHVRIDQSSAGNNSPWYTGVRVGGISNSIESCHIYAYNKGVSNTGSPRNDVCIYDSEILAQITAGVHLASCGSSVIVYCDIEGNGAACFHGIWLEASTSGIDGGSIAGNYIAGFATNGIWLNGDASKSVKGVSVTGNEVNCGAATNAVKASYTEGCVLKGNELIGLTNWLNLDTSNINFEMRPNYTSGALAVSGTAQPEMTISTLALTFATPGNLVVAYTIRTCIVTQVGRLITLSGRFLTSTFTHTTAVGDLTITGLPFTSANISNAIYTGSVDVWGGITKANYTQLGLYVVNNSTSALFVASGSGQAASTVKVADVPTGGTLEIVFSITYPIA